MASVLPAEESYICSILFITITNMTNIKVDYIKASAIPRIYSWEDVRFCLFTYEV